MWKHLCWGSGCCNRGAELFECEVCRWTFGGNIRSKDEYHIRRYSKIWRYHIFVFGFKSYSISRHDFVNKITPVSCKSLHLTSNFRLGCTRSLCLVFGSSHLRKRLRECVAKLMHIFLLICYFVNVLIFSGDNISFGRAHARAESFCTEEARFDCWWILARNFRSNRENVSLLLFSSYMIITLSTTRI